MKPRSRDSWILLISGLIVSLFLVGLWIRSFESWDSVSLIFSYKSRIILASESGTVKFSVDWSSPSPIYLESGFDSQPLASPARNALFGHFEFRDFNGRGFRISVPHWLIISLVAATVAGLLLRRKIGFESAEGET